MTGVTTKPFSAYSMAGLSSAPKSLLPKRSTAVCHASTAPGTVTEGILRSGTVAMGWLVATIAPVAITTDLPGY